MSSSDAPLATTSLTTGFDSDYRPGESRVRAAITDGLIILDTNVLLHVLRFSPTAREELLGAIEALKDRVFIPHQIAVEFNRRRVDVVSERLDELSGISTEVAKVQSEAKRIIRNLRDRRALASENLTPVERVSREFSEVLQAAVSEAIRQYDLNPDKMVGQRDNWTQRLDVALDGRVALPPPDEVFAEDEKESIRRRENKIAPGFKDSAGGDYLWWAEVLRCPRLRGKPLAVVSDDSAKGDWRATTRGIPTGPHSILRKDVLAAGGTDLVLLTTSDLLSIVLQTGASTVSEGTIEESRKISETAAQPWKLEWYVSLLSTLFYEGYEDRVDAIRAAASLGGFISRSDLYDTVGLDENERSLRKFATPVTRITTLLPAAGVEIGKISAALKAEYEGPGKAVGYSVPSEFVEFEGALDSAEKIVQQLAAPDWQERDSVQAKMRSQVRRSVLTRWAPDASDEAIEMVTQWAMEYLPDETAGE